jgi:probable phosphoglycerate mutase
MTTDNGKVVAYVLRHGRTKLNEAGKFRGIVNAPLDPKGVKDVEEAKEFLKGAPIGSAYSSDLGRAKDSAHILLGKNKKLKVTEALRPIDVGALSGQDKDENKDLIEYLQNHPDQHFPGGGQSIDEFNGQSRKPLLMALRAGLRNEDPSLISTHASVIHSLGKLLHDDHKAALVKPGGLVEVTWDGKQFNARPVFKPKESEELDDHKENVYAS